MQFVFVLPLAQYLRCQGHDVVLACSDDPGEARKSFVGVLRQLGFEVKIIPIRRTISLWWDTVAIIKLYCYLRKNKFDVIHARTAKAGMIGRIAGTLARVPVIVYTPHVFSFHEYLSPWKMHLYAVLERLASRLCNVIVVDSESVRGRGLKFKVAPPEHIRVIPMGVDTELFDPGKYRARRESLRTRLGLAPEGIVVGAVCRLIPDKGLDCLLQAVKQLSERYPAIYCVLAGDGPFRDELRQLSVKLHLQGRIVFAGHQTDVPAVLATMDIFMLPTLREGFGVAVAEAMSMEVPVIVSRIPAFSGLVIDGYTGLYAAAGDSSSFAKAAKTLLEDPEQARRLGIAARDHVVSRFSQSEICRSNESLYFEFYERCMSHD